METIEIDTTAETGIAAYEPIRAQLATMKETNANAVFAYETPKGNAAARSHIFGIRKVRAALESARKDAKAFFLEQGRKVDSEAKEIQSELDAMIAVHEAPLLEIEEREKARIAAIRERIAVIFNLGVIRSDDNIPASCFVSSLADLRAIVVDDTFEEFQVEALGIYTLAERNLTAALAVAEKREAEEAELERLRKEEAARQQKEREDRIAAEAAAKAKADAEAKAKADAAKAEADARAREKAIQDEADRKEREAQAAKEKAEADARKAKEAAAQAERDRVAAAEKAEADKAAAVKAEQDRQAAEAARIERERIAREKDEAHRAEVIDAATTALFDLVGDAAPGVVEAIIAGRVPNVKVVF